MKMAENFKELILPKIKFLRNFSISNVVMNASNQELGNWFNSLQSSVS